jgi:transcription elongation factor GreA
VVFGATVEIEDIDSGKLVKYQIVGEDEANIKEGRISIGSPIARALIGKEVEDVVMVKAPGGNIEYEIISVDYI